MSTQITQTPLYGGPDNGALPVGQNIIFTVFNNFAVTNKFNVKYKAEVHIGNAPINLSIAEQLIATFKTTPNNVGRGIYDLQSLLEGYISSDNLGSAPQNSYTGSQYKGVSFTKETPHPIHLIDKFARNTNAVRYFAIQFSVEGSDTPTSFISNIANSTRNSVQFIMFNGVLQHYNYLTYQNNNYGYNLSENLLYTANSDAAAKFLTNAPTTLYANDNDYGTLGMLCFLPTSTDKIDNILLSYYDSSGGNLGDESVSQENATGGSSVVGTVTNHRLLYFGAYPANLRGWSTTFRGLVSANTIQGGYYTVQAVNTAGEAQQLYTINVNCPNTKGFESVRLTWLNQWGVWDYYTFTMKSTRSLSTNRTTYTQTSGTWNKDLYKINGFKGGKKNFRVNTTESFSVNTDFINEAEAVWFEELIGSQEVYILNGFDIDEVPPYDTITNKYVEPVLITSSNYIRKTIANDKLIQYTFEMERNKTQLTQTS